MRQSMPISPPSGASACLAHEDPGVVVPDSGSNGPGVRHVVERQFHDEGHVLAAKQRMAEGDAHQHQHQHQQVERDQRKCGRQRRRPEESRSEEGEYHEPRAAWHQWGKQAGEQAPAARLDHPRTHHRWYIAAKTDKQRQEALAM